MKTLKLDWPVGWRRTPDEERAYPRFGKKREDNYGITSLTVVQGSARIYEELSLMDVDHTTVRISCNDPNSRKVTDPGVAVYWKDQKKDRCIACDRYTTIAGNMGAIAATLDAMRAIERHGGATILDRAFMGFNALPSPEQWFQVLGVPANANAFEIEQAYRRLASTHHPDRSNGSGDMMARINRARDQALEQFS